MRLSGGLGVLSSSVSLVRISALLLLSPVQRHSALISSSRSRNFLVGSFARRSATTSAIMASTQTEYTISTEELKPAPRVLSIQSHTVHGYVGNKAATLPLQCLGYNVEAINTVTLSNHPAYPGGTKGQSMDPTLFRDIVTGLTANSLLGYDVILTGYVRSADVVDGISSAIQSVRQVNADVLVVCDPVLGDNGRYYVPEEIKDVYLTKILPQVSVLTPNQFEAEALSGIKINSLRTAREACSFFHSLGVRVCVLKGLQLPEGKYSIIISYAHAHGIEHETAVQQSVKMFQIDVPLFSDRLFSGCGDLFSALMAGMLHRHLGHVLCDPRTQTGTAPSEPVANSICFVMEQVARAMATVLHTTHRLNSKELCIVECIDTFRALRSLLPSSSPDTSISLFNEHAFRAHPVFAPVAGIIFDMDGTLTMPGAIDFGRMYDRLGIDRTRGDIILQVQAMATEKEREEAYAIILEEELVGIERMQLRPGLAELLDILYRHRVRVAIATRNCQLALEKFVESANIEHHRLHPLLHRHSLEGSVNKPDPRVAQHVLRLWGIPDTQADETAVGSVWFVGDSLDDMLCGKAAGCKTCLISTEHNTHIYETRKDVIDLHVHSLQEFVQLIGLE